MSKVNTRGARLHRHIRVRAKIEGTGKKPRLAVFRSLDHVYAQVIDDSVGKTIVTSSTLESEAKSQLNGKSKTEQSKIIGKIVAQRALKKGIETVVFDRGGFKYHGRVKALAEAAREAGLKF
jgi:large subunit ribosomal protein L18